MFPSTARQRWRSFLRFRLPQNRTGLLQLEHVVRQRPALRLGQIREGDHRRTRNTLAQRLEDLLWGGALLEGLRKVARRGVQRACRHPIALALLTVTGDARG